MIDYDPHRWWSRLFTIRGSLVRELLARLGMVLGWSLTIALVHHLLRPVGISLTIHTLAGVALSLLLVFRTNSSYDRFWEGRKLWGGIVNETRNLARASRPFLLKADPELYRALLHWTMCFPYAAASCLKGKLDLGPMEKALSAEEVEQIRTAQHCGLAVSIQLSELLAEGRRRGHYAEYVQLQLDQNVQLLIDYLGACERIHKTPIPYAYMIHLRRTLAIYFVTLPFALVEGLGWGAVPATCAVAYLFLGIEEIGVEIEDPFGDDPNDLPLGRFCENIRGNLAALLPPDVHGARRSA